MVKNLKNGFNGEYGVKLTPNKLKVLCEVDLPALGIGWLPKGSLAKSVVNDIHRVIVGRPEHLDQFPYIDCWQDAVLSWPRWVRPCL
jgi:hypothetical protein